MSVTAFNFNATITGPIIPLVKSLYYAATSPSNGNQLHRFQNGSDGLLTQVALNKGGLQPQQLTPVDYWLFFVADDGGGSDVWITNGITGIAHKETAFGNGSGGPQPSNLTNVNKVLYFAGYKPSSGYQIYTVDIGTMALTQVTSLAPPPNGCLPQGLSSLGFNLYFSGDDGVHGRQLWLSPDKMLTTGIPRLPLEITPANTHTFFTAIDDSGNRQLWVTNGAAKYTRPMTNFVGGNPNGLVAIGSTVYFVATDDKGTRLWKSDGNTTHAVTTTPNGVSPYDLVAVDTVLYFVGDDGIHGSQVWKTNGTNTVMVTDIDDGDGCEPANLTNVGGMLYFTAYDPSHGNQVYRTNGLLGSQQLLTTFPNAGGEVPANIVALPSGEVFCTHSGASLWQIAG